MKLRFIICSALLVVSMYTMAQKVSLENVIKPFKTNFGAIKEGTDVKGYYFFWASDKIDKNTYEWTLRITDVALKTLKEVKLQESKKTAILETSFNGTDLILLFYDDEENTFDYQVYGADGKKKFNYSRQLTKKEERYLKFTYLASDDEKNYKGLYPVEGQGFISNMPSREDKDYTFQIDYFGTNKRKQWTYIPQMSGKKFVGDYLGSYNGVIYVELLKFSGMLDGNPESSILGLSLETGKLLFETPTDGKFKFYPATMSVMNDGHSYIYGEYFNSNDNIAKDKSLGFAFWSIDEKGKIQSEKYLSWEQHMGKYLDVTSKGKIADFGFMFLHNMVQTSNGDIYAIGEGYKKAASALGIAATLLTRNSNVSTIKVKVTDMLLIKFDKNFDVKQATIYDKNSNSVELQSGMEFVSTPLLGKMIKYNFNEFDYSYSQTNKDVSAFTVAYSDYVRGKDYKGSTFNTISYNEGKITTDHINTKSDASRSFVLPSTQGSVLILDIYKKDKKLEGHIEKMN
jgi:hypothetical protein